MNHPLIKSESYFHFKTGRKSIISIMFCPDLRVKEAIIRAINNAFESIFIICYALSDVDIINSLYKATQRNIKVTIIIDQFSRQLRNNIVARLNEKSDIVFIMPELGKIHSKIIFIDSTLLISGSANLTSRAFEKNLEIVTFIHLEPSDALVVDNQLRHIIQSSVLKSIS